MTRTPGTCVPQMSGLHTVRYIAAKSPNEMRWLSPSLLVNCAARSVRCRRFPSGKCARSAGNSRLFRFGRVGVEGLLRVGRDGQGAGEHPIELDLLDRMSVGAFGADELDAESASAACAALSRRRRRSGRHPGTAGAGGDGVLVRVVLQQQVIDPDHRVGVRMRRPPARAEEDLQVLELRRARREARQKVGLEAERCAGNAAVAAGFEQVQRGKRLLPASPPKSNSRS